MSRLLSWIGSLLLVACTSNPTYDTGRPLPPCLAEAVKLNTGVFIAHIQRYPHSRKYAHGNFGARIQVAITRAYSTQVEAFDVAPSEIIVVLPRDALNVRVERCEAFDAYVAGPL